MLRLLLSFCFPVPYNVLYYFVFLKIILSEEFDDPRNGLLPFCIRNQHTFVLFAICFFTLFYNRKTLLHISIPEFVPHFSNVLSTIGSGTTRKPKSLKSRNRHVESTFLPFALTVTHHRRPNSRFWGVAVVRLFQFLLKDFRPRRRISNDRFRLLKTAHFCDFQFL